MLIRRALFWTACVLAASSVAAQGAGAATTLGTFCVPGIPAVGVLIDPTTSTAPSDGVITRWGFGFPDSVSSYPQQLLVLAPSGAPNGWTVVSIEGALASLPNGSQTSSRVPVKKGQVIGSWGTPGALVCAAGTSTLATTNSMALPPAGAPLTSAAAAPNATSGIYASLEPDADGDGYGDETQDACPRYASSQGVCPVPRLSAVRAAARGSFAAWVTTDLATTVVASGSVTLPSGAAARKLKFRSKRHKTLPGLLTKVKLKYPGALRRALAGIDRRKSVKLTVTLTADGVVRDSTKKFTVRLRGTK